MAYLSGIDAEKLLKEAESASKNSYSPYSKFSVGAAVLSKDGRIFRGTNVENISYGLTICAERIAIGNAVTNGSAAIDAIAIYAGTDSVSPCGACRQFILEFGKDIVVIFRQDKNIVQRTINELLPFPFTDVGIP